MWCANITSRTSLVASSDSAAVAWLARSDLPRTTNDLEHFFGSARYHERRATGRKFASPGTVVRGAVRLVAAVATRKQVFAAEQLCPVTPAAWRALRRTPEQRHQARRCQFRFRRRPAAYLAELETALLKPTLPS